MEIPVMTSASTHGLRSAVSACTKPSSSYLNSSTYSGGCLKKIVNTVKKSDSSSFRNEIDLTKKRKSSNDCGILCKKNKNVSNVVCAGQSVTTKNKNGKLKNICSREEVPKKFAKTLLNSFPNGLNVPGEPLSKINSNNFFDQKLTEDEVPFDEVNCGSSSSALVRINDNDSSNNDRKVNGTDFSAINSIVHNISINDVGRKTEKCVDNELVNVNHEGKKRETNFCLIWLAESLVTKTAPISRERPWFDPKGLGASLGNPKKVLPPLNSLRQFSPQTQVQKALEQAENDVPFEENYPIPKENECVNFCGIARATPTPRHYGKNGSHQAIRGTGKLSKTMRKYDVFLGGSCNPTTWRKDIAIPTLNKMGISFYNPQVSQWRPDLLELEYQAKENAAVMFFVIDNQTRGVSTLVEVAHIAGSKRNLILVIQSYTQEKQTICGELISQREFEDLRDGQEVLRELVESQHMPVFDNIYDALERTEKLIRSDDKEELLRKLPHQRQIKLREAYDALVTSENDTISLKDACLALQLLTQKKISLSYLNDVAKMFGGDNEAAFLEEEAITFEQFSLLTNHLKSSQENEESLQGPEPYVLSSIVNDSLISPMRDVFLCGSSSDASWKENIAVPLLKKHGLSYFNPRLSELSDRFLPIEAAAMSNSFISLIVITSSARSVVEMTVASHYIGLGAKVILCIQHLPDGATISGDKLSENAVKDYNRGRIYLTDIAKRNGTKVFSDIYEAVQCVIEECQHR